MGYNEIEAIGGSDSMNIYDVARMAGVSTATVSRVINHSGKVSEESRRKVESVIAREGYIPNAFAHSLNTKKSATIGIICPVISDVNHANPVSELSHLLRREGFEVLLINTENNMDSKREFFVSLIKRQVDAAIVIGCNTTLREKEDFQYAAEHIPVFIINGRIDGENIYCCLCDEASIAKEAVRLLCQSGYEKVLSLYDSQTYSGMKKLAGYREGMRAYSSFEPIEIMLDSGRSSFYGAAEVIRQSQGKLDFDAVFTADDSLAAGAMKVLAAMGREKTPMIGFNNTILGACTSPELTSVDNHLCQQCSIVISSLRSVLRGEKPTQCLTLEGAFCWRESFPRPEEVPENGENADGWSSFVTKT